MVPAADVGDASSVTEPRPLEPVMIGPSLVPTMLKLAVAQLSVPLPSSMA